MKKKNGRKNCYHNPKRGKPGILVFCETGREKKCIAEGMEILDHYYTKLYNSNSNDSTHFNNENENNNSLSSSTSFSSSTMKNVQGVTMSLEEEIQLLQKENVKSAQAFQVYETGCRGVVFFMCTLSNSHCKIIVEEQQKQQQQHELMQNETSTLNDTSTTATSTNTCTNKRKEFMQSDGGTDGDIIILTQKEKKKQKTDKEGLSTAVPTATNVSSSIRKWDPIETIEAIVQDIRNNDSTAPMSRFVTKMIPIQATCFATMEEIQPTMKSLLQHFLLPHGIEFHQQSSKMTRNHDNNHNDPPPIGTLPTFKIAFRKRFCSHLNRNDMILFIADTVDELTKEYWLKCRKDEEEIYRKNGESHGKEDSNENIALPPLFGVDLVNPDYTIIIEVCRTLCTMSVVKDAQSYYQFNLMKIKEHATG